MVPLSVVIVTWNQKKKLEKCLWSIYNQEHSLPPEVVVVDNNSLDRTPEVLEKFPKIKKVKNQINRGVAVARNQGIAKAQGKYLMMLDDDTHVYPGCFEKVISFMDKNPDCWCAGTKTLNDRGELEYNARTFYTLPIILFRRTFLERFLPSNRFTRRHLMTDWDHNTSSEVDWVAGASYVMRREAIDKIGPFDEGYFFGFEDMDWCYRVHAAGKKVFYIHDAIIVHSAQRSSRKIFSKKAFSHLLSTFRFYYRNHLKKSYP